MSQVFKDWKGQLMGTFHTSPGGIKTVITNVKCPKPNVATIYFTHPHFEMRGTKAGPQGRMMSVAAYPPDVIAWLSGYQHVEFPQTLRFRIYLQSSNEGKLHQALDMLLYAELKSRNANKAETFASGELYGQKVRVWKIEPYYFVLSERQTLDTRQVHWATKGETFKTVVEIETADILCQLMEPEKFHEIDHDRMFEALIKVRHDTLAGLWLLKPEYFQVLEYADQERWQVLFDRVQRGILNGK